MKKLIWKLEEHADITVEGKHVFCSSGLQRYICGNNCHRFSKGYKSPTE